MALAPDRARAAALVASGLRYAEVATEVDVHEGTIKRWAQTPAFKDAVQRLKSARDGQPAGPRDVLHAGMAARDEDGIDWRTRVACAMKLIDLEEPKPEKPAAYYLPEDDELVNGQ